MRWRTEGDDAQEALFPDADRHIGRGEFRGMEFLHVKARSIINTLPASGRLPFRHTINAYRGCSHACTYCFARPTHGYLGLDIGEGFERQVVVKVNAVERLRAELDPRRWCGEPIAMGTNTDPYQRAEGKYHLTRGLVEELGRARNPFSILTKSTLVLRDADVLAEAAERTDVTVSFSVGTLDEEVWRATEPGTPPPRKRLEALAKLRERGLSCGVLVAPVLPGLSDTAESIDAVVAAATEAGATSVSGGMVVYLKPGVREVFLGHLAETHPDLVPRYEAMFRGVNAPSAERQRVADLLHQAQARHRGRPLAPPRTAPHRNPRPRPSPAPKATGTQLGLGM
ncbi:MAG TPA: radical SAM protein [Acidimicrobiales bacterium]|nr:radical SAM protein [Acidimicrobiales bacterium]